jgi:hypothetical protein
MNDYYSRTSWMKQEEEWIRMGSHELYYCITGEDGSIPEDFDEKQRPLMEEM